MSSGVVVNAACVTRPRRARRRSPAAAAESAKLDCEGTSCTASVPPMDSFCCHNMKLQELNVLVWNMKCFTTLCGVQCSRVVSSWWSSPPRSLLDPYRGRIIRGTISVRHHKVSGIGMASQSATFLQNEQRKRHQFFDPAAINPHVRPSQSQVMMLRELNKVAIDLVHISWKQGFPSQQNGYLHDIHPNLTVTVMAGSPAVNLGLYRWSKYRRPLGPVEADEPFFEGNLG